MGNLHVSENFHLLLHFKTKKIRNGKEENNKK